MVAEAFALNHALIPTTASTDPFELRPLHRTLGAPRSFFCDILQARRRRSS